MTQEPKSGFVVTQSRLALVLSLCTLMGLGFQGTKFLLDTNYRITAVEEKLLSMGDTQKEFVAEVKKMNETLILMNLTVRELQVRAEKGSGK